MHRGTIWGTKTPAIHVHHLAAMQSMWLAVPPSLPSCHKDARYSHSECIANRNIVVPIYSLKQNNGRSQRSCVQAAASCSHGKYCLSLHQLHLSVTNEAQCMQAWTSELPLSQHASPSCKMTCASRTGDDVAEEVSTLAITPHAAMLHMSASSETVTTHSAAHARAPCPPTGTSQ